MQKQATAASPRTDSIVFDRKVAGPRTLESRLGGWNRLFLGVLALVAGCSSSPQIPPPFVPPTPDHFSAKIARLHLDSLSVVGSRQPGSESDLAARSYIREALRAVGAQVRIVEDAGYTHLVAEIAGDSADRILLVAAYPMLEQDEWIGDSSVALLLELARAMSFDRPAYTLQFAFAATGDRSAAGTPVHAGEARSIAADVDAAVSGGQGVVRQPDPDPGNAVETDRAEISDSSPAGEPSAAGPALARRRMVSAGESLARALAAEGEWSRYRGVLVFDGSAGSELRMARDLRSHPVYREVFWTTAASLGFGSTFPSDSGWSSPQSLHLGFKALSMDRVLALVDETRARSEVEATPTQQLESERGLEAVGLVTVEALDRIMLRLSRIDAFTLQAPETSDASVAPSGGAPAAAEQASPQVIEMSPSS